MVPASTGCPSGPRGQGAQPGPERGMTIVVQDGCRMPSPAPSLGCPLRFRVCEAHLCAEQRVPIGTGHPSARGTHRRRAPISTGHPLAQGAHQLGAPISLGHPSTRGTHRHRAPIGTGYPSVQGAGCPWWPRSGGRPNPSPPRAGAAAVLGSPRGIRRRSPPSPPSLQALPPGVWWVLGG